MKVKELIKILNKSNQEAEVYVNTADNNEELIASIEICSKNLVVIDTKLDTYDKIGDIVENEQSDVAED